MIDVDIVTVFHNETNFWQALELQKSLEEIEDPYRYSFMMEDNSVVNRGFSQACNDGAKKGDAPIIGFLNPDAVVSDLFIEKVVNALKQDGVVITGSSHNKPRAELKEWGLRNWVCGCTMFVDREWFDSIGGFDHGYVWAWEDTDLCRMAEYQGHQVKELKLPIHHESPTTNAPEDSEYKNRYFKRGAKKYFRKWKTMDRRVKK